MKIVHVINGLEIGGAEKMLVRLATSIRCNHDGVAQIVVSLSDLGILGPKLRQQGIEVVAIGARSFAGIPYAVWRLAKLFRQERPTVVQSWLYRSDLISALAGRLSGRPKIAWGIRCTSVPQGSSRSLKLLIRLNARISTFLPDKIVCCAEAAKNFHAKLGFDTSKMVVIPNGFDFDDFRPSARCRDDVRRNLGVESGAFLIGIVGRYDELKDFENFIDAAALALAVNSRMKFVMIGKGLDVDNPSLYSRIVAAGMQQKFILLGARDDVAKLMRGMDVYCLSSRSEGFPNVVVEAMGTALPCVVTDVGDAAAIVGDTGKVVPPRNPKKLASALIEYAKTSESELRLVGEQARERAKRLYSLHSVTKTYMELFEAIDR